MPSSAETLSRLDALLGIGLRLARTAPSGRIALAQLAEVIDIDWIPQPWGSDLVTELEAAKRESVAPIAAGRVRRILREAWDEDPDRTLDSLEAEPVRVTPTAQVHRGALDGSPVAVKVLRPGLAGLVRQDLALLETLAAPIAAAFPALDVAALLREVRERVLEELDLESAAHVQRRLHRALRGHPLLHVPAPITSLTHESVLVSEWVDGTPLAAAGPPDRDRAAALLVVFVLGAARWGTTHAALQLRDVLLLSDGRISIVDIGASAAVSPARLDASASLVEAFVAGDDMGVGAALQSLGWLPAERAGDVSSLLRDVLGPFANGDPVRLDGAAVEALRDRARERPGPLLTLLADGRLEAEDLWPARGLAQLFAALGRAGATAPWRELVRLGLREGWEARPQL